MKSLKALEGVLTPRQIDSYQQLQAAQLKMIQGFLPGSKKAAPTSAATSSCQ